MKIAITIILICLAVFLVWGVIMIIPILLEALQDMIREYDDLKKFLNNRKHRKEQE
jgi:predicted PurR-regulated permease PerM